VPKTHIVRIQEAVHGLLEFRGLEAIVVDVLRTPEIQRTRRIRQLGLCHYVFPSAEHSRLVHSLGASWLAIRFARQLRDTTRGYLSDVLRPSETAIADLALAALCHDIGHGPLSHAWEREIVGREYDRAELFNSLNIPLDLRSLFKDAPWHEITTAGLLLWKDGELNQLLENYSRGSALRIVRLLRGEYWLEYLPGLLRGEVDVDRADYIRRDTHQTGVAYGRYDLDWLISTCTVGEQPSNGKWVVGFDSRKAPRVIEQFLVARIALYETVYCHKTVRAAEGMVKNLFRRLKQVVRDGSESISSEVFHKAILSTSVTPADLLDLDDFALFVLIGELSRAAIDPIVRDLSQRILSRDLFKLVPVSSEDVENFLLNENSYDKLYEVMKPFCPGDPQHYLVRDDYSFKFFNDQETDSGDLSGASFLIDSRRKAKPLRDHSDLRMHKTEIKAVRLFTLQSCVTKVADVLKRH